MTQSGRVEAEKQTCQVLQVKYKLRNSKIVKGAAYSGRLQIQRRLVQKSNLICEATHLDLRTVHIRRGAASLLYIVQVRETPIAIHCPSNRCGEFVRWDECHKDSRKARFAKGAVETASFKITPRRLWLAIYPVIEQEECALV